VSNKLSALCVLLIPSVLTGCVTGSTVRVVSDYCRIAQPIGYDSRADSAETVKALEAHNSQWVCLCEKDCPKPSE
jgi:hypothetical protein